MKAADEQMSTSKSPRSAMGWRGELAENGGKERAGKGPALFVNVDKLPARGPAGSTIEESGAPGDTVPARA